MKRPIYNAFQDLKLDKITLIYPGEKTFPLDEKIEATNLETYLKLKIP